MIGNGKVTYGYVADSIELEMPPQKLHIARHGFERINLSSRSHTDRSQQRIKAYIRPNIEDSVSFFYGSHKECLFRVFVATQPATVVARTNDPFFSAQSTLHDWEYRTVWNQAERQSQ